MPPVDAEEFHILVEQGIPQSGDDPLPVLFPNPKGTESFQPLLFLGILRVGHVTIENCAHGSKMNQITSVERKKKVRV